MEHKKTYDILNKTENEIYMIIWALSRTGNRIHACLIAHDTLDMTINEADAFTRNLRDLSEFSLNNAIACLP